VRADGSFTTFSQTSCAELPWLFIRGLARTSDSRCDAPKLYAQSVMKIAKAYNLNVARWEGKRTRLSLSGRWTRLE
jgi:hypothetical protein